MPGSNQADVYYAGSKYRGTLLFVDKELLVLKEKNSEELLGFATPQVEKIYFSKNKTGIGIVNGLATVVGFAAGLVTAIFANVGGNILASISGWKRFKLDKLSELEKEKTLIKIQDYALLSAFPTEQRSRLIIVTKQKTVQQPLLPKANLFQDNSQCR